MTPLGETFKRLALQTTRNTIFSCKLIERRTNKTTLQCVTLLTTNSKPTIKRRRRKKHTSYLNNGDDSKAQNDDNLYDTKTNIMSGNDANNEEIADITFHEYLQIASLSPWVPTPDPVARRMLEVAEASESDIHYDLGSGDGRLNFMAIDVPFNVKQSTGIEIDDSLIQASNKRLQKRHPNPTNLNFRKADLMPEKEISSEKMNAHKTSSQKSETTKPDHPVDITNATVVTMYFVEEALLKLKPMLQDQLFHTGCRVVTCGYDIEGWEPRWVEIVLGLPIYLYVLDNDMNRMEDTFALTHPNQDTGDSDDFDEINESKESSDAENEFDEIDDFKDDIDKSKGQTADLIAKKSKSNSINKKFKFSK